jgi:hypothetical protein
MTNQSSPGLRPRSVGLRGDWIASITNVAPTAATTLTMAALIGASGLASPLALLIAGAAMLCCAVAYHRLNNWQASAAAPVEWVVSADLALREPRLAPVRDRRGWPVLHRMHVLQAPEGCDYDFLAARTPDQLTFIEPVIGRS